VFGDRNPPVLAVLDFGIDAELGHYLSLTTSMHDLVFTPKRPSNSAGAVIVRSPGSLRPPRESRHSIADDRIRANQGHSLSVDLGLAALPPPNTVFQGTADRFLDSIRERGLHPGQRQQEHLSADFETAVAVGRRHGKSVVLLVAASHMHADGYSFFRSDNGGWLTASVPTDYLGLGFEPNEKSG
jgi:hypothetical protein